MFVFSSLEDLLDEELTVCGVSNKNSIYCATLRLPMDESSFLTKFRDIQHPIGTIQIASQQQPQSGTLTLQIGNESRSDVLKSGDDSGDPSLYDTYMCSPLNHTLSYIGHIMARFIFQSHTYRMNKGVKRKREAIIDSDSDDEPLVAKRRNPTTIRNDFKPMQSQSQSHLALTNDFDSNSRYLNEQKFKYRSLFVSHSSGSTVRSFPRQSIRSKDDSESSDDEPILFATSKGKATRFVTHNLKDSISTAVNDDRISDAFAQLDKAKQELKSNTKDAKWKRPKPNTSKTRHLRLSHSCDNDDDDDNSDSDENAIILERPQMTSMRKTNPFVYNNSHKQDWALMRSDSPPLVQTQRDSTVDSMSTQSDSTVNSRVKQLTLTEWIEIFKKEFPKIVSPADSIKYHSLFERAYKDFIDNFDKMTVKEQAELEVLKQRVNDYASESSH